MIEAEASGMLDIEILAKYKDTLLEIAQDNFIREVKITGDHVREPTKISLEIKFILIPETEMTVWHKRAFEKAASFLLKKRVNALTPDEVDNTENAVALEIFVEKNTLIDQEEKAKKTALTQSVIDYLKSNDTIWQRIVKTPEVLNDIASTLYLEFLAQRKTPILMLAKKYCIQDVKIFGKCLGQKFYSPAKITFLIIPNEEMTDWHQRRFETEVVTSPHHKINVFTERDLYTRIEHSLATEIQVKDYVAKAISIETLQVRETREENKGNTINSTTPSTTFG